MKDPHFSTNRRHMIAFKKPNVRFRYKFHNKIKLCKRAKNWKLCCLETKTDACDKASKGRKHTGKYIMHFRCQPRLTYQFHFLDSIISDLLALFCLLFCLFFYFFPPLSRRGDCNSLWHSTWFANVLLRSDRTSPSAN